MARSMSYVAACVLVALARFLFVSYRGDPADTGIHNERPANQTMARRKNPNQFLKAAKDALWKHQEGAYPDTYDGWWWSEDLGVTLYYDVGSNLTISPWVKSGPPSGTRYIGSRRRGEFEGCSYLARRDFAETQAMATVSVFGDELSEELPLRILTNIRAAIPDGRSFDDLIDVLLWRTERIVGLDGEEQDNPTY